MNSIKEVADFAENITHHINNSFAGSKDAVHLSIIGLAAGLHILIEDVPGVGKTTLARTLAQSAGLSFSRIQFTPDMLPGDVLGMNVWNPSKNEFVFRAGSIQAQCILADELNRTSPRTQSAFLEAMQEGHVTIDGITRQLPQPFFMIATQNPQSFTGTFPLPEAELDRFGLSFSIGYPTKEEELTILNITQTQTIEPVTDAATVSAVRALVNSVQTAENVQKFIVDIIQETRNNTHIKMGASPRAAVYLQQAAKAEAALNGRAFVLPEDVLAMSTAVLSHRIILAAAARLDHMNEVQAIKEVCARIPIPAGI